ncbi:type IV conjugative transfer system protein TraL [Neiella sp. HB171785]|uniref:Type IV conjugative transfer system protein TraL n=1 Tax=Neiella litorisoli TaxID=2771431 RepID=A0A8J6QQI7_9GAMM|nr:type IV conjugative transfer system protein TraL [Neiella litorisoli]MBD1389406.1 type IV conjugative transfer system protein TraL [Neiella litorisoli]
MANSNAYRVPRRINDPMIALVFDVDQLGPSFMIAGFGNILGVTLYGAILGLIWFFVSGHIKRKYPDGFLLHMAWYYGIVPFGESPALPDPLRRDWLG